MLHIWFLPLKVDHFFSIIAHSALSNELGLYLMACVRPKNIVKPVALESKQLEIC